MPPRVSRAGPANGGRTRTRIRLLQITMLALTMLLVACRRETPIETITSIATLGERNVITIRRGPTVPAVPVRLASFCDHWASLAERASEFATAPANTPPDLTTNFDATTAFVWSLAETAPLQATRDFHSYAVAWSAYADRVIRAGYDFSALELDPDLQDSLRSAGSKVNAWSRVHCAAALTVPTDVAVAMLGRGAPVFPANSAEGAVQEYIRAVADRDVTTALSWLPTSLVGRCRDALREAISLRESQDVRAALELTTRRDTTAEVRVRVSESFGSPSSRRPETERSVAFEMQRSGDLWQITGTSWPAPCPPAKVRPR